MNNEEFLAKWNQNHEKGLLSYILRQSLPSIIGVAFVTILFIPRYQKAEAGKISYPLTYLAVISLMLILGSTWRWFQGEKRYKETSKLMELTNKCPACSSDICPQDENCPSCGLFLKMGKDC